MGCRIEGQGRPDQISRFVKLATLGGEMVKERLHLIRRQSGLFGQLSRRYAFPFRQKAEQRGGERELLGEHFFVLLLYGIVICGPCREDLFESWACHCFSLHVV